MENREIKTDKNQWRMKTLANVLITFALLMMVFIIAYIVKLCGGDYGETIRWIGGFATSWVCYAIAEKITAKINNNGN